MTGRVVLDRDATALDAWTAVLRAELDAMVANESGVRAGVDPACLHDFRVAVRRSRSVLRESKRVLPHQVIDHARRELGWLGSATSAARDLDVLVHDTLPSLVEGLDAGELAEVDAAVRILERQRAAAYEELVADLESERYARFVEWWRAFLYAPEVGSHETPRATEPARSVAAKRIRSVHRRLLRDGRRVTPASAPEALHELRKDAKRLRYLLECFGSLYRRKLIAPMVKELKALQDVLGTYQDCQVQIRRLEQVGAVLAELGPPPVAMPEGLGRVLARLAAREQQVRSAFEERFARFCRVPIPAQHVWVEANGMT
ncbi:CHAD domain-containing protein [Rhabdothermincola sediminis]|uniref:CHAD domain-containing protein n=1 Tax=Rhabdothermincola sediminis TaxID=2751370 RepID=UPI001AA07B2D|nr:CHAD domain-containing protein [Rhabdothermincola sediminis]